MALSIASAKTYTFNVFQPAVLAGTELKVGEYKLEINGDKVQLKNGTLSVEANVKVENTPDGIADESAAGGQRRQFASIKEIRLGGTNMKLVVN